MCDDSYSLKTTASDSVVNDAVRKALRHFAGCIAHDFNNLLTVQLAYPDLIKSDLPTDSKACELLDVMEENAELMSSIASRLAHFALSANYAKKSIAVDDIVREVASEFASDNLAVGITVKQELNSNSEVMMPHDVFRRVLREICTNSLESMNGSGTLTIETKMMSVDEPMEINSNTVPVGDYVCISVYDTGSGLNDDVIKNALEPFYSLRKKSKARGVGLGLSIAFAGIHDCGGYLLVKDKDEGSAVSIILPMVVDKDTALDCETIEKVQESGTSDKQRVLLVDDEEEITRLFKIMLTSSIDNIEVDVANNGCEAIRCFKKYNHSVIVMDLHMPVMDGQEAFEKLQDLCETTDSKMPGVVFCTGYIPPDGIKKAVSENSLHGILQKPVTTKYLIDAVKERLNA